MATKTKIVQAKNLITGNYLKIDLLTDRIIAVKTTKGPYKDIPKVADRKISKTWEAVVDSRGTGQILDMRAVMN